MTHVPRAGFAAVAQAGSPAELLTLQAAIWPDRPLLILPAAVQAHWGLDKGSWTYAELEAEVQILRAHYRAAGYGAGHRVALLLENRPAHFFHWLALNGLGVSVVPVNPDYAPQELAYLLTHSDSTLLVTVPGRLATVRPTCDAAGVPVVCGDEPLPRPATVAKPAGPPDARECALAYTSGTTGTPKGCRLSNRYFLAWGEWYVAQGGFVGLRPGQERLITPLPTFHVNAMGNSFMGMLAAGGAQVMVDRFHPKSWIAMARETSATCFHYLGVMPAILMALPESPDDRDHAMRFGLGGGAHPDHHRAFEARYGAPLLEGWAMTETGGAILLSAVDEPRHIGERCLGRPDRAGPPMEFRIVDDRGQDVPPGAPGEFLVRAAGPDPFRGLFLGYLKDEAATAAALQGGWFHTGDILRQGADGSLHFVERKKNIIRRSGENIAAIEVEGAISAHPAVAQVAVLPASDPIREEEVLALVVLRAPVADEADLAQSIIDTVSQTLAYYKVPGYLLFADSLPTTATGKLRKADLAGLAADPLAQPGAHDFRAVKQALRKTR